MTVEARPRRRPRQPEVVYVAVESPDAVESAPTRSVYTIDEAAEILGVGPGGLLGAIRRGEVPALQIGWRRFVSRPWLDRALAAGSI